MISPKRLGIYLLLLSALGSIYAYLAFSSVNIALSYSKDGSTSLGAFAEASAWLSQNIHENEIALVPMFSVFNTLAPMIRDNLMSFQSLWRDAGVVYRANTTVEEILKVREFLTQLLRTQSNIKYVVSDWIDPYSTKIFSMNANDELLCLLSKVNEITFRLSTNWENKIEIYQRIDFITVISETFDIPPNNSFTIPSLEVLDSYQGVVFKKNVSRVGYYLPLTHEIAASKHSYIVLKTRFDMNYTSFNLVFYYDRNGDHVFSGYDTDYVLSTLVFDNQSLPADGWHLVYTTIPFSNDPVVQLGMIFYGTENGQIAIKDLVINVEKD